MNREEVRSGNSDTIGELPSGTRITDYISLGVITKTLP
jgi:hypothetical protein